MSSGYRTVAYLMLWKLSELLASIGHVVRLVLPTCKAIALVEYGASSDAIKAFRFVDMCKSLILQLLRLVLAWKDTHLYVQTGV